MLRDLLAQADIFSQGYRPRALAALGFLAEQAARISPGIVYVSLSAYGHAGPWAERRGFELAGADRDRLQPRRRAGRRRRWAEGIAGADARSCHRLSDGVRRDDGARRQSREGGSWHVQVSLARTGRWLWKIGRMADGLATADLKSDAVEPFVEEMPSGFGPLRAVRHAAQLSRTPAFWSRPAVPLGSHAPQWPRAADGLTSGLSEF